MTVVAIYTLPVPLWVSAEVLDNRFETGFRGVQFDVLTPGSQGPVGTPPGLTGYDIPKSELNRSDGLVWAQRFAAFTPGADHESTAICRVVCETRGDVLAEDPYPLSRAIDAWFDALRTWVEVTTGQDVDPNHKVYDATVYGANLRFIRPVREAGPVGISVMTPRVLPMTHTGWRDALSAVASGEEPPLEEMLSRDARSAFARNQPRRAVSDAASAAEIVLLDVIRKNVQVSDLPDRRSKKKFEDLENLPLGGLVSLAQLAGLDLRLKLSSLSELSQIRNAAIHRGQVPDHATASRVVQASIDLLALHGPWRR